MTDSYSKDDKEERQSFLGGSSRTASNNNISNIRSSLNSLEIEPNESNTTEGGGGDSSCHSRIRGVILRRGLQRQPFNSNSSRLRRSLAMLSLILVFCLIVIFREGEEEESILRLGNQMEEDQEGRDVNLAHRQHNTGSSSSSSVDGTYNNNIPTEVSVLETTGPPTIKSTEELPVVTTSPININNNEDPAMVPTDNKDSVNSGEITAADFEVPIAVTPNIESTLQQSQLPVGTVDDLTSSSSTSQPIDKGTIAPTESVVPEKIPVDKSTTTSTEAPESSSSLIMDHSPPIIEPPRPVIHDQQRQFQTSAPFDPNMELQQPNLPLDTSNEHPFVQQYCDLQGSDWFPNGSDAAEKSWRQRAPFVMLVGPSHGGSDVLWRLLATHPQISDAMKSQFFTYNYKLFVKNTVNSNINGIIKSNSTVPPVRIRTGAARQAYMARHISAQRHLQNNPSKIVLDSVPDTLLYSDKFAPFVLCVMPWVKLVVTVSHPIRRLLRHYQAAKKRGLRLSLEDWIARDLERMQQAGVLQDSSAAEKATGAPAAKPNHDEAWTKYQQLTTTAMEASAGQSLYEYIVHPWFTRMEEMGRNPSTEIVVVQRELLIPSASASPEDDLVQEYQRVLKRIGLTKHTPSATLVKQIVTQQQQELQDWKSELDDALRKQLKHFFTPYNVFFDQFLKSYYGNDGKGTHSGGEDSEQLLNWNPDLWLED